MKVLIISNLCIGYSATLPELSLYRGLHGKGVDLTVMAHWQTTESLELESSGIPVVYHNISLKIDFKAIRKIRTLLIENRFDILHLTYSKAITNGLIASHGLKVKIIAYLGSLSIYWHDPTAYLSFLNRRINYIICVSDTVREHIMKQAPDRMKNKTVRIYKGFDPEWLKEVQPEDRTKLGIPANAFIVCCVANIRKIKGIKYLVKAADHLPDGLSVWFILIGKGSDSPVIKNMILRTKYAGNFVTKGYSEEPLSYISLCNIYIQPSLSEGLGRSLVEAMSLGKPVLVTDKGGAKELVSQGINGFIVPVRSSRAIADKINYCYQNREELDEMGKRARERIMNDFHSQTTIDQTYGLYQDVLKE
jgi:glycosyltransferase involved in cell wall biosynthesis